VDRSTAVRLSQELPAEALVLDVGGGGQPYFRADYILDFTPFSMAKTAVQGGAPRYTEKTWVQFDICSRQPWPFPDKFFDYVVCSHTLEDIRDPIAACAELSRVAKAGYVETPSRIVEQSIGVEDPNYAGYTHHRWLLNERDGGIEFRPKQHCLHSDPRAIVTRVRAWQTINPKYANFQLEWRDHLDAQEIVEFETGPYLQELADFASSARRLADLTIPRNLSMMNKLKRALYYQRLRWARP
jgi:SAM-dependent methyltransferase